MRRAEEPIRSFDIIDHQIDAVELEERCSDEPRKALVAIGERVIAHHRQEQHRRFLIERRMHVFAEDRHRGGKRREEQVAAACAVFVVEALLIEKGFHVFGVEELGH